MYDAILFGVDGTAMPAFGDILTVNDIWDLTNFVRTIPNGGLLRDPDPSMMISPADVKPIEVTPLALPGNPGAIPVVTPQDGLGATGGQAGNGTPQASPTRVAGTPTAAQETGPGAGGQPSRGGAPATPENIPTTGPPNR